MKPTSFALSFSTLFLSSLLSAQDQTIQGNLTVEGDADIQGDALSLGTRADTSTTPGFNFIYADAMAPTIYFSATRDTANWMWQRNENKSQMKLDDSNKLQLFNQATTPIANITLDPTGISSFANSITIYGYDNRLPNQIITGAHSILTQELADNRYLQISEGSDGTAVVLGLYSNATGDYSTAIVGSNATGDYSTATAGSNASGYSSTSSGGSNAWGDYSTAMGESWASDFATAFGRSYAGGPYSTATGGGIASGAYSIAIGGGYATNDHAITLGRADATGLGAIAIGNGANASGTGSIVLGIGEAQGRSQIVIGPGNIAQGDPNNWAPTDDLFIIGNGQTNIGNSNAVTIHKNGNARISGNLQVKGGIRVPPGGDISMGHFTAGNDPSVLNEGLRYTGE